MTEKEDLYRVFGMDSAAGRAMFQLYKKKVHVDVPKPKQKSHEQLLAEAEAAFRKLTGGENPAKKKPAKPKVVVKFKPKEPEEQPKSLHIPKRKPLEVIRRETHDYAPEPFRPVPSRFRNLEKEKARLQELYAQEEASRIRPPGSAGGVAGASSAAGARAGGTAAPERSAREQLIDMLYDEIDERQRFLDEMAALGQAGAYEAQIRSEVATRLAELRKLEAGGAPS